METDNLNLFNSDLKINMNSTMYIKDENENEENVKNILINNLEKIKLLVDDCLGPRYKTNFNLAAVSLKNLESIKPIIENLNASRNMVLDKINSSNNEQKQKEKAIKNLNIYFSQYQLIYY